MSFEIIRDGKVVMHTSYEECIPPVEVLRCMMEAGHTFNKDGKTYKPSKAREKKAKEV